MSDSRCRYQYLVCQVNSFISFTWDSSLKYDLYCNVTVYLEASHRDAMNENNKDKEERKTRKVGLVPYKATRSLVPIQ